MCKKVILLFFVGFLALTPSFSQTVGLVLSGGGAKGAVHIGVIKALEDNDIPIDYIAGTSIGAIVGSMYAMGYTPTEMLNLLLSDDFYNWQSGRIEENFSYYFKKPINTPEFVHFTVSLNDSTGIKASLPSNLVNPIQMNQAFMGLFAQANAVSGGNFDQLFVPFLCVASDIYNTKSIICRKGNLGDVVRASMTIPFIFRPIEQDNVPLYDGGIYDNFPVKPMMDAFHPDFIIGSVVVNDKHKKMDQSFFGQMESIIMGKSDYSVDPDAGMVMYFNLENVNLLDFQKSRELYRTGYKRGQEMADSIKSRVVRSVFKETVDKRRREFKANLPPLLFKNVTITGVNSAQKKYIKSQFARENDTTFDMEEFKRVYFRLLTDSKIKEIKPSAVYNAATESFDLHMDVTINNEISLSFGGNISSANANQLYLGIGYQSLTNYSINFNCDLQAGNTYSGVALEGKIEFPNQIPVYLRGILAINMYNYYESEKLFIDTELSTFIRQQEMYGKIALGLPFTTKARSEIAIGYGILDDKYYQSNALLYYNTDYDKSRYNLFLFSASLHKNTFNAKQYPISGQEHLLVSEFISGSETFTPAGLSLQPDNSGYQSWLQLVGRINNFHSVDKNFSFGYLLETTISSKNLLSNYTASILQAPAFTPTPHSKIVFNEAFRSNQYLAAGLTSIWKFNQIVHLRGDFDVFLPAYKIMRGINHQPYYGELFRNPAYLGEATLVCQFPFLSIGLFGNYYSFPKQNWNFGVNIGYLIFGSKFIQ